MGPATPLTGPSASVRSDQMGNKASYIHLRGSDLRPQFHQFTAVVSHLHSPLPPLGLDLGKTRLSVLGRGRAQLPSSTCREGCCVHLVL